MSDNRVSGEKGRLNVFRVHGFKLLLLFLFLLITALFFSLIKFDKNLKFLDLTLYSGPEKGNYYRIALNASERAGRKGGKIQNIPTRGSVDNIRLLKKSFEAGRIEFAILQDGITPGNREDLRLIARLPYSETVFFVGKEADRIENLSDIRGMRIGIGPVGSGTDHLVREIFRSPGFDSLGVKIRNFSIREQLKMLKKGDIHLAVYVIAQQSDFIRSVMGIRGIQMASFRQSGSIAERIPSLKPGIIRAGYFDPVKNIPERDKPVLKVDTLVVCSGSPDRSDVTGLLRVLSGLYPHLIDYNRNTPNLTGMEFSPHAVNFYDNRGPEFLDLYAPVLVKYIPLGIIIQLAMVISILFNLMAAGDRFCLWRIDEKRIKIERSISDYFGRQVVYDEIPRIKPLRKHLNKESQDSLQEIISSMARLLDETRKQSRSILVPMGKVMGYRYQENLIESHLSGLRAYFRKLKDRSLNL